MRVTTTLTGSQVMTVTGATETQLAKLRNGRYRQIAAGPLGSGKVTFSAGRYAWTRNPETVHASLRAIDQRTR
jgi:hypothetical protein